MLNKNFNTLLSSVFMSENTSSTISIHDIKGSTSGVKPLSTGTSNGSNTYENMSDSDYLNGSAGIFLFTDTFNEDSATYVVPTEFTDYSVTSHNKSGSNENVALMYTRTITPKSNATIKSIGLLMYYYNNPCLIAFENLAEPVQLTAEEPHTFTFSIKV